MVSAAPGRLIHEPVSHERAVAALGACGEQETGSVERWEGGWCAVCTGVETGPGKWVNVAAYELTARCEAKAELDYRLAEVVGAEPDSAWEDSFAACIAE